MWLSHIEIKVKAIVASRARYDLLSKLSQLSNLKRVMM
jgi:hypothetical protein